MAAQPNMIAGVGQSLTLSCELSGENFESLTNVNLDLRVHDTVTGTHYMIMMYIYCFHFMTAKQWRLSLIRLLKNTHAKSRNLEKLLVNRFPDTLINISNEVIQ